MPTKRLGYKVIPDSTESRHDIIQAVELNTPEALIAFCQGIQAAAPVDSFVSPEPWAMPGYDSDVIMAAGAFVQGSSIELSADGPLRPPYTAFFQGGLTWYHCKIRHYDEYAEVIRSRNFVIFKYHCRKKTNFFERKMAIICIH